MRRERNRLPSDARLSFHWRSLALPLWWPHGTRSWTGTLSWTTKVCPRRNGSDRATRREMAGVPVSKTIDARLAHKRRFAGFCWTFVMSLRFLRALPSKAGLFTGCWKGVGSESSALRLDPRARLHSRVIADAQKKSACQRWMSALQSEHL